MSPDPKEGQPCSGERVILCLQATRRHHRLAQQHETLMTWTLQRAQQHETLMAWTLQRSQHHETLMTRTLQRAQQHETLMAQTLQVPSSMKQP